MRDAAANLASIMVRPRATMRRILDAGRDRAAIAIVVLASVSGFVGDLDVNSAEALRHQRVPMALLIAGLLLGTIVVGLLIYYLFAWAVFGIGKLLEGTGTARDVRSAVGWGLAPVVWALLYRVPIALFWRHSVPSRLELDDGALRLTPGAFGAGCLSAAVVGLLELTAFAWCLAVASNTIGEAHRVSSWRGLAAILLTLISPALIALAAFLAS